MQYFLQKCSGSTKQHHVEIWKYSINVLSYFPAVMYLSLTNITHIQRPANFSLQIWRLICERRGGSRVRGEFSPSWWGDNLTRHTSFVWGMKGGECWGLWESSAEADSTQGACSRSATSCLMKPELTELTTLRQPEA